MTFSEFHQSRNDKMNYLCKRGCLMSTHFEVYFSSNSLESKPCFSKVPISDSIFVHDSRIFPSFVL